MRTRTTAAITALPPFLLTHTCRHPPPPQEEFQQAPGMRVKTTVNQMRQEDKFAFILRVTDTTSTQIDHDSVANEVAAMTHAKLDSISEHDVPIDSIRAIYTKGGTFNITVPESFGTVAKEALSVIGIEQDGTGFKYRLRYEDVEADAVHKGKDVRDTNTWFHLVVGKNETASFGTIKEAANQACSAAGVTFVEDKFHELKTKQGVGQGTGKYHCQFELKSWKFDWAATKMKARIGATANMADIFLSQKFIASSDLCKFCWSRPLAEFDRPSAQERWPCTCFRTHGTGERSDGKRKYDHKSALERMQKTQKDIGDAPF